CAIKHFIFGGVLDGVPVTADDSKTQSQFKIPEKVKSPSFRTTLRKFELNDRVSPLYASSPNLVNRGSDREYVVLHSPPSVRFFKERVPSTVEATKTSAFTHFVSSSTNVPSMYSSTACLSNTTFDSGFLSDSTYTDLDTLRSQCSGTSPDKSFLENSYPPCPSKSALSLHQDNPTYGCLGTPLSLSRSSSISLVSDTQNKNSTRISLESIGRSHKLGKQSSKEKLYRTPKQMSPDVRLGSPVKQGSPSKQTTSVTLRIENGLFATVRKDGTKLGRSESSKRDRRSTDLAPIRAVVSSVPPPQVVQPGSSHEGTRSMLEVDGWRKEEGQPGWRKTTTSGTFLARCVKVEDLSSRETSEDLRDGSGGQGDSSNSGRHPPERRESGRFTSAARILRSLARSSSRNEISAGDSSGLSRTNPNYHSEGKGLRKKSSWRSERELTPSPQKERSQSFNDKPSDAKRRYSYHDNKALRDEGRSQVDKQGQRGRHSISGGPGGPEPPTDHPPPAVTPPTVPASLSNSTENVYEDLPESDSTSTLEGDDIGPDLPLVKEDEQRPLERSVRERRSARKLTKDSGYDTSPYSESDYANIDLYADGSNTDDGDDITLAPESEFSPSEFPYDGTSDSIDGDTHQEIPQELIR
ncbi:unnamed protein product, partial [Meganyctiphanes norvegica]